MHHTLFSFPLSQEACGRASAVCFSVFWPYRYETSDRHESESVISGQRLQTKSGVPSKNGSPLICLNVGNALRLRQYVCSMPGKKKTVALWWKVETQSTFRDMQPDFMLWWPITKVSIQTGGCPREGDLKATSYSLLPGWDYQNEKNCFAVLLMLCLQQGRAASAAPLAPGKAIVFKVGKKNPKTNNFVFTSELVSVVKCCSMCWSDSLICFS